MRPPPPANDLQALRCRGGGVKARKVSSGGAVARDRPAAAARSAAGASSALTSRDSSRPMRRVRRRSRRRRGGGSPRPYRPPRSIGTLRADQADVADVVLRAGMVAAGQVDVDGAVERDARLAPVGDRHRRGPWCWRRRTCSRCCRCRRRGRRGRLVASQSRPSASIAALRLVDASRRRRRRSAGSARR